MVVSGYERADVKMKANHRLALVCLALATLLLGGHIVWTVVHISTPPAVLPPAGEALPGSAPYTFAIMGDSRGNNSVFESILTGAQRDGARLIIHTGDLVRDCTKSQFEWILEELQEMDLQGPLLRGAGQPRPDQSWR